MNFYNLFNNRRKAGICIFDNIDEIDLLLLELERLDIPLNYNVSFHINDSILKISLMLLFSKNRKSYMLIDSRYTSTDLEKIHFETDLEIIISDSQLNLLSDNCTEILILQKYKLYIHSYRKQKQWSETAKKENMIIFLTSGTTGTPKAVFKEEKSLTEEASLLLKIYEKVQSCLCLVTIDHPYGFLYGFAFPIVSGKKALHVSSYITPKALSKLMIEPNSLFLATPFHYKIFFSIFEENKNITQDFIFLSSGSPLEKELQKKYNLYLNNKIREQYGTTETGVVFISGFEDSDFYQYKLISGVKAEKKFLKDDNDLFVLIINTPYKAIGYLNNKKFFIFNNNEGINTGDIYKIENNKLIYQGRKDALININGQKFFPEEIERIVNNMTDVKRSRLISKEGKQILEIEPSNFSTNEEAILFELRKKVQWYKIPKEIRFVDTISTTNSGKIRRVKYEK